MAQPIELVFDAFFGSLQDLKNQTTFCERYIQTLINHASVCGIMW
jgi:hypothetical protein